MKSRTAKEGPESPGKMERLERELLLALAEEVKRRVREHSGHALEEEVRLLGVAPPRASGPTGLLAAP